jgi:hypothetical protein
MTIEPGAPDDRPALLVELHDISWMGRRRA